MAATYENVLVTDHENVRVLSMNRPAKKNAFNVGLAKDLTDALDEANAAEGVSVVVVTAEGDLFSAGADLSLFLGQSDGDMTLVTNMQEPFLRFKKPVIAAVNGTAVGMGVTLLPYFDMVYASERAVFKTPFVKLGLVLEFASSFTLPRLIGRQRTNEMILRGEGIDAKTAADWGLVTRVFAHESLMEEVLKIARDIAGNGPNAVRNSKDLILKAEQTLTLDEALKTELQVLASCYGSEENMQAAMAFFNKKKG